MPTLIIEDGSIVAGANSWITVAEWDTYNAQYGRTPNATTDDEKELALIKAQRAISTLLTYWGQPVSQTQTTCLPRYWQRVINGFTIGSDQIPQDFKDAQAELAWSIDHGADPFADRTADNTKRGVETGERNKAGPVETSSTYSDVGIVFDPRAMSNYTAAYALLSPYVAGNGAQIRMQRG